MADNGIIQNHRNFQTMKLCTEHCILCVITRSIFPQNPRKRHLIAPPLAQDRVFLLWVQSDSYSDSVTAVMQEIAYHIVRAVTTTDCITAPWDSYQIRKIAGLAYVENAGNISPPPLVSDPSMHHGTCVTHVPWRMSGSLTCHDGKEVHSIPGACATNSLRICQEVYDSRIGVWEYHRDDD